MALRTTDQLQDDRLYDKEFIGEQLRLKSPLLSYTTKKSSKSEVWTRFVEVSYDQKATAFAICIHCQSLINRTYGTGGLLHHKCKHSDQSIGDVDEDRKDIIVLNNEYNITNPELKAQKEIIIDMINRSDPRITFASETGKSEVWQRFERIFMDQMTTEYVKCKYCPCVQKQTRLTGTRGMLSHECQNNPHYDDYNQVTDELNVDITHQTDTQFSYSPVNSQVMPFANPSEEKQVIVDLIKNNDNRIELMEVNGKSKVWERFDRIVLDGNISNYVKCKHCHSAVKHNSKTGSGSLLRHRCHKNTDLDECNQFVNDSNGQNSYQTDKQFSYISVNKKALAFGKPSQEKQSIVDMIESNDHRIELMQVEVKGRKSENWNRFERILMDGQYSGYVKCKLCNYLIKHNNKSGSGGLNRHRCHASADNEDFTEIHNQLIDELSVESTDQTDIQTSCMSVNTKALSFGKPSPEMQMIIDMIENNDDRIELIAVNGTSETWKRFERIAMDGDLTDYVKCKHCHIVLQQTNKTSSGELLRHRCPTFADNEDSNQLIDDLNVENSDQTDIQISCMSFNTKALSFGKPSSEKQIIIDMIENNDDRIELMSVSGTSEVWKRFERIAMDDNLTDYVKCKHCHTVLKQTNKTGSGGLLRHRCPIFADNQECNQFIDDLNGESSNQIDNELNCINLVGRSSPEKQIIIDMIENSDDRIEFMSVTGTSEVWKRFERIAMDDNLTDYVKCKHCHNILKHNSKTGSGGLLRHRCPTFADNEDSNVLSEGSSDETDTESNKVTIARKKLVKRKLLIDKQTIIDMIINGDERLEFMVENGKSDVWKRFERIFVDGLITDFVKCKHCPCVQKQNNRGGTGGLLSHKCLTFTDNEDLDDVMSVNSGNSGNYSEEQSDDLSVSNCVTDKNVVNEDNCVIKQLTEDNKTLKQIVDMCLEMLDNCVCDNKYDSQSRQQVNRLLNDYNKKLNKNQDTNSNEKSYKESRKLPKIPKLKSNFYVKSKGNEGNDKSNQKPVNNAIHRQHMIMRMKFENRQRFLKSIKNKYEKTNKTKKSLKLLYMCDWPGCERKFRLNKMLDQHTKVDHLGIKMFACEWPGCEDCFSKKAQLTAHTLKYHTHEKRFKCDECSHETAYKAHLILHKRKHSNEKALLCDWPGCDFGTNYDSILRLHKYRHSGEKPYKCSWPSCESVFRSPTHLKAHRRVHTGERPNDCLQLGCDRKFASRQAMRFHMQKVHNTIV